MLCNHISCSPTLVHVSSYHISCFSTLVCISSLMTSAAVQTFVTSEPYQLPCHNSCCPTLLYVRSSITSAASSHQLLFHTVSHLELYYVTISAALRHSFASAAITSVAFPHWLYQQLDHTHQLLFHTVFTSEVLLCNHISCPITSAVVSHCFTLEVP